MIQRDMGEWLPRFGGYDGGAGAARLVMMAVATFEERAKSSFHGFTRVIGAEDYGDSFEGIIEHLGRERLDDVSKLGVMVLNDLDDDGISEVRSAADVLREVATQHPADVHMQIPSELRNVVDGVVDDVEWDGSWTGAADVLCRHYGIQVADDAAA